MNKPIAIITGANRGIGRETTLRRFKICHSVIHNAFG